MAEAELSSHAEGLLGTVKARYLEKLKLLKGLDPLIFCLQTAHSRANSPVEATDVVSYLALETSFVTAKQFKPIDLWKHTINL